MNRNKHPVLSAFITFTIVIGFHTVAFAGMEEGNIAYKAKDFNQALLEWRPLAEDGNPEAQLKLGQLYNNFSEPGDSDEVSGAKSRMWYRKSAEQGNTEAEYKLGYLYYMGFGGVKKDEAEALKWFRKSAEGGLADAQMQLGGMYGGGFGGVKRDHAEAAKWYQKCAENDKAGTACQTSLGMAYLYGKGVREDDAEAIKWFRKSADNGGAWDANFLGDVYANGTNGVLQDFRQAEKWYHKAAIRGHKDAQRRLGLIYRDGKAVLVNPIMAHAWLNLAATTTDAESGNKIAAEERLEVEQSLSPKQLLQAQQLAVAWEFDKDIPEVKYHGRKKAAERK